MHKSKEFTTNEARSVLLVAATFALQNFTYVIERRVLLVPVSYGDAAVKMLPLLVGQSRGAEVPRAGVMEFSVAIGAEDALLEVDDGIVALLNTELVDGGTLGTVRFLCSVMMFWSADIGRKGFGQSLKASVLLTLLLSIVLHMLHHRDDRNGDRNHECYCQGCHEPESHLATTADTRFPLLLQWCRFRVARSQGILLVRSVIGSVQAVYWCDLHSWLGISGMLGCRCFL